MQNKGSAHHEHVADVILYGLCLVPLCKSYQLISMINKHVPDNRIPWRVSLILVERVNSRTSRASGKVRTSPKPTNKELCHLFFSGCSYSLIDEDVFWIHIFSVEENEFLVCTSALLAISKDTVIWAFYTAPS